MVFPATPLGLTVELYISGAWTNVTSLMYGRDDLVITRGRSGEGKDVERSACRSTANNRSGNLSPRNPTGIYYGQIGRNTPMRARLTPGPPGYLLMFDDGRANTPDSANLSITGDIDIRLDIRPDHWDRAQGLANKATNPSQRSWVLWLNADGTLSFLWSADGSATITKTSTAAVAPPASGRLAVRVTLDVDNGAAGNDVKFYTASTIDGSWTQLGSTVTTAGVTSIFDSTANLEIGGAQGFGGGDDLTGRLYAFQLYQGIAGTLRADVDLSDEEPGPGPFTDGQSLVWALVADASIVRPDIRFSGEVSEWPQRWDTSGRDVYVPLEASGILRRLGQGASALKSTMYRGYTSATFTPKAYWPCEDGEGATEIASGISGHPPMTIQAGANPLPDFASHTGFKCSAPLPTFNGTQWTGIVPAYAGTGDVQVWFLAQIPAGSLDEEGICAVYTTGTIQRWSILYDSAGSGNLRLIATDSAGTELVNSTAAFAVNGKLLRIDLELHQNGADVEWDIATLEVGQSSGSTNSGTVTSQTISRCTAVVMNAGADHTDIAVGHISVHSSIRSLFDLDDELNAYAGETAGRRVERLCGEEGVTFRGIGDLDAAAPMGPQLPQELVALLRECADADLGILFEPRDLFGLAYRTRDSLCAQDALLALDYDAKHLSAIEPTDDDQQTRNDITAKRVDGASARAVKETGVLSVLAPPSGVGRYDEQVELNLQTDGQLPDMAGWRLHLGTVDEARYPVLGLDLARSVFTADSALALAAQDLDIGDRLTVADPPAWLPPDDITQLAQGFTETMANFTHRIDVVCAPETPYGQAGVYDESRYTSDGSTLNEDLTTTETGVDVATPSGPLWSDADGDFDIIVGGERMTVTAISGAASPQTFTCTRSVNGVVKTHSTGAAVELFAPAVYVP
jgi:hypothetical protein